MLIGQKQNNSNRTRYAIHKESFNMIKLTKCELLPLNMNSFFDFKLESYGSVI